MFPVRVMISRPSVETRLPTAIVATPKKVGVAESRHENGRRRGQDQDGDRGGVDDAREPSAPAHATISRSVGRVPERWSPAPRLERTSTSPPIAERPILHVLQPGAGRSLVVEPDAVVPNLEREMTVVPA